MTSSGVSCSQPKSRPLSWRTGCLRREYLRRKIGQTGVQRQARVVENVNELFIKGQELGRKLAIRVVGILNEDLSVGGEHAFGIAVRILWQPNTLRQLFAQHGLFPTR